MNVLSRHSDSKAAKPWLMIDELLEDEVGEASEGGGSEAPLIEEEPPVKCECAPCKGGAPAWMATFADMATLRWHSSY